MNCIKCKSPAEPNKICSRHQFCTKCLTNIKQCEICTLISSCVNCSNKSSSLLIKLGNCEHKLCSNCVLSIYKMNNLICPICKISFQRAKIQAYVKYITEKIKLDHIQCQKCGKKGSVMYKDYYQCIECKTVQCLIHKQSMKKCRCRCLECFRQARYDIYGKVRTCRCVTSQAIIRQKSPSPYRPVSSRDMTPKHQVYFGNFNGNINELNNNFPRSPNKPQAQRNQAELSPYKHNIKQGFAKTYNNFLNVPNSNQQRNQKPLTPNRQISPKMKQTQFLRPVSPYLQVKTQPSIPINENIKLKSQNKSPSRFPEPSTSIKIISPPINQINSTRLLNSFQIEQQSKLIVSSVLNNTWKCTSCQSVLQSKPKRNFICNYCTLSDKNNK